MSLTRKTQMRRTGIKSPSTSRSLKARKRLQSRPKKATKTVDGDPAREIKRECDSIVSQIIAIQGDDCFVCGIPASQTDLHPGHFITRKVLALRWHLECNIRPQCNSDNSLHNEDPTWYRSMLVLDIGESNVAELERVARKNPRVEYPDLLAIRDDLRAQLKRLTEKLKR